MIRLPEVDTGGQTQESGGAQTMDLRPRAGEAARDDRLALFLYFYLDLPLEEVGTVLGLSAGGAKTRVYRAAKKLRPGLEMD